MRNYNLADNTEIIIKNTGLIWNLAQSLPSGDIWLLTASALCPFFFFKSEGRVSTS